jgi:S1-C subfamily serine protease
MRSVSFVVVAAVFCCIGCAHQGNPLIAGLPTAEKSIFPIYVPNSSSLDIGYGARQSTTVRTSYKSCAAVYVAPHLLVTSAAVMPAENGNGVTLLDIGSITLRDGDYSAATVTDVPYSDLKKTGLAVVKTTETGTPMRLRNAPIKQGEPVKVLGYTFTQVSSQFIAVAEWQIKDATVSMTDYGNGLGASYFRISAPVNIGMCGSPVVDSQGLLVGIAFRVVGGETVVITAETIANVLASEIL